MELLTYGEVAVRDNVDKYVESDLIMTERTPSCLDITVDRKENMCDLQLRAKKLFFEAPCRYETVAGGIEPQIKQILVLSISVSFRVGQHRSHLTG